MTDAGHSTPPIDMSRFSDDDIDHPRIQQLIDDERATPIPDLAFAWKVGLRSMRDAERRADEAAGRAPSRRSRPDATAMSPQFFRPWMAIASAAAAVVVTLGVTRIASVVHSPEVRPTSASIPVTLPMNKTRFFGTNGTYADVLPSRSSTNSDRSTVVIVRLGGATLPRLPAGQFYQVLLVSDDGEKRIPVRTYKGYGNGNGEFDFESPVSLDVFNRLIVIRGTTDGLIHLNQPILVEIGLTALPEPPTSTIPN